MGASGELNVGQLVRERFTNVCFTIPVLYGSCCPRTERQSHYFFAHIVDPFDSPDSKRSCLPFHSSKF